MPEPLPLADLLASLRDQGLPVGVREHLVVGRLLARWDDTDPSSLRGALGAVLARNPDEVRAVHETFDRLYGAPANDTAEPPVPQEISRPRRVRVRRAWIAGAVAAALALALVAAALLWPRQVPEPVPLPPPAEPVPDTAPPPPEISDTLEKPDWERSFTAAAGIASGLFLWLFGVRLRREARLRARRRMIEEADALPGPHRYEISLDDLAPPFTRELLDDAASLLGRRITVPPRHGDLDVERTLARTLRAGLAPSIVLRARASTHPLLVLEDVGDEMRPWRRRVSALLSGLETRGVPIDRWRFHADAGRVFRDPGAPPLTLKQLFRLRAESPLLVISTGEGLLEGIAGRPAPWTEALQGWRHGAWLHPVTDPAYWRPALQEVPILTWPMTPAGVMAAARQLVHGATGRPVRESARASHRVSPLDVERLRWLLTLAPRRDPDLAELLRQRFCPQVPPAALLEALEAPPLAAHPGVGPSAEEVHTFLADLLAASEPPPGTAAHERWRLDHALQEIRIPGREKPAARELEELAQGPLAVEVVNAVERVTGKQASPLRKRVLRQAYSRGEGEARGGWRWTWPDAVEVMAALVCLALLGVGLTALSSFRKEQAVPLREVYKLSAVEDSEGYGGSFYLRIERLEESAPSQVAILQGDQKIYSGSVGTAALVDRPDRESWFYVRATELKDGWLGHSRPILVSAFAPDPQPPNPPPSDFIQDTPAQMAGEDTGGTEGAPEPAGDLKDAEKRSRLEALLKRLEDVELNMKSVRSLEPYDRFGDLQERHQALSDAEIIDEKDLRQLEADISRMQRNVKEPPSLKGIKPDSGPTGESLTIYISGDNFAPRVLVTFYPEGIKVLKCTAQTTEIICEIEIAPDASPGPRNVTISNVYALEQAYPNVFYVQGRAATAD